MQSLPLDANFLQFCLSILAIDIIPDHTLTMKTCEGYLYKRDGTFQQGLVCTGAILPPTNISPSSSEIFDVIVLGAGFAGLTACRDLTLSGTPILS